MEFRKDITELIKKRISKRTYLPDELPSEILDKIYIILKTYTRGIFGNTATYYLVDCKDGFNKTKEKIGTYGFISGARYFIAGIIHPKKYAFEDYGYLFEKIILELTALELGTCWLGGTFSRSTFAKYINTDTDVIIPAVSPLGHVAPPGFKEKLIRRGAKADKRKNWNELFFVQDINSPLSEESAAPFAIPLEMVRLAPSASNKQPWRIIRTDKHFDFYLKRTPGYNKLFRNIDLQKIDMGIAMAHFELTCQELNLKGEWKVMPVQKIAGGLEYICSWSICSEL